MTIDRWSRIAGWLIVAGSVTWGAKFAVIVATNGRVIDTGAAAWLLRLGLLCLLLGATGLGGWSTRQRRSRMRLVAVLLSPILFLGSFVVLDLIAATLIGTRGPAYLHAEAGLVVSAGVWLMLGIWLVLQTDRTAVQRSVPTQS